MTGIRIKVSVAAALFALMMPSTPPAHGATFHVSPFGSNTPPYDTYAKAATDPRDAIESASGFGDTVFIHAGRYDIDTTIVLPRGLVLLGSGADSASLIPRRFHQYQFVLKLGGDNEVAGITVNNETYLQGLHGFWAESPGNIEIHHSHLIQVTCYGTPSGTLSYHDNLHEVGSNNGIETSAPSRSLTRVYHNRFLRGQFGGDAVVFVTLGSNMEIYDNIIDLRERTDVGMAFSVNTYEGTVINVRNNLILGGLYGLSWHYHAGSIENNTFVGTYDPLRILQDAYPTPRTVTIRNNAFVGIRRSPFLTSCRGCVSGATIVYVHNSIWPSMDSLWQRGGYLDKLTIVDSGNFAGYPIFTSDSTYRLQYGSPLIDKGDPNLLDVDGSRSDVGWTGGPGGVSYAYVDLPPEPPDSLRLSGQGLVTYLAWSRRPEHDLKEYRLYRGDYSGFWHAGQTPIYALPPSDTDAYDAIQGRAHNVFYVVTAVDSSGHESLPSKETPYIFSGVDVDEGEASLPRSPSITRIYPNPFNAATTMEVFIPDVGAMPAPVRVVLYDVMGRLVSVLFDGSLNPGNHAIAISVTDTQGHALASGVYFARLRVWGAEFGAVKKLVVLK